jgi:GAF domain-containing protein
MSSEGLAERLARVSTELSANLSEEPTVHRVCEHVVELVPGCEMASVTLRRRDTWDSLGATDPLAQEADGLQYTLEEGPCLESSTHEEVLVSNHLSTEDRWPRWGPAAAARGVHSIASVPLGFGEDLLGALNLYARHEDAFDDESRELAVLYGMHAANAIRAAKLVSGLETALSSRHRIGIAQGVLMQRYSLSEYAAFDVLRRVSSRTNRKLRDVAEQVVATGDLPELPPAPVTDGGG